MDSLKQIPRTLIKTILTLLIVSVVLFGIGISNIYYSFCKETVSPLLALLGLGIILISFGVGLAHALIMKSFKSWLTPIGLFLSFSIMTLYFYVVSFVRCSGV